MPKDPGALLLGAAGAITVLAAAAGAIAKGARWMFRTVRRMSDFLDDWNGEPARSGHDRVPGVMERLEKIEKRLSTVESQVTPNGGSSLRDDVTKIKQATVPPDGSFRA